MWRRRPPKGWRGVVPAAQAWAALTATQIGLHFVRFQTLRRYLLGLAGCRCGAIRRPLESATLLWSLRAAGRRCPVRRTCLGEALVAEALLRRHGHDPVLCIGARRGAEDFQAHAWIELDQMVVLGGPAATVQQYSKFPEIGSLAL